MASEDDCLRALREAAERLGGLAHGFPVRAVRGLPLVGLAVPDEGGIRGTGADARATIQRVMGGWNEAKGAAGLATNASTGTRIVPKPDDVELPDGLEWAELSQDQRWYYRNRGWNRNGRWTGVPDIVRGCTNRSDGARAVSAVAKTTKPVSTITIALTPRRR